MGRRDDGRFCTPHWLVFMREAQAPKTRVWVCVPFKVQSQCSLSPVAVITGTIQNTTSVETQCLAERKSL